jgi:hypothetical protein
MRVKIIYDSRNQTIENVARHNFKDCASIFKDCASKARYHWPWAVGAGVVDTVGGEGWGLGMKGRGVAYFLPQTCYDIYHTGVFQKYVFCS